MPPDLPEPDGELIHPWAWHDGDIVPSDTARTPLTVGGLHYGVAVLEGLRIYDGRPFRLRDHSERLLRSARTLRLPVGCTAAELDEAVLAVVAANGMADGYIRPLAWRADTIMRLSAPRVPAGLTVLARPLPSALVREELKGLALVTSRWRRPPPECGPVTAKCSAGYLIGTLAHLEATEQGFDDALLLDAAGRVCESTGANVFAVIDGVVVSPPPGPSIAGITRAAVLRLAARAGLKTCERHMTTTELARSEEVFLTGTALEVAPVSRIDDTSFPIGEITRMLAASYRELVLREER
jgi:branched-chain amino acid aminotransferase